MEYRFTAWGHKNITGKHKRTLEFTKDSNMGIEADCIIGITSNFSIYDLKELAKSGRKLKMVVTAGDVSDSVLFEPNPDFNDERELVIRMGDFSSGRTFGVRADKACSNLKRELVEKLKSINQKIDVLITDI